MEIISTPRLVVRPFTLADLPDFLNYQSLPAVRQFLRGNPLTEEESARFLIKQAALEGDEKNTYHAFAVECHGRVIGDVGVYLHKEPADEGDVGFQFDPGYHGQGLASEAMRGLIQHLFQDLGLRRLTAGCDARNTASYRLMERLGMKKVGESEGNLTYELLRKDLP